jgi:hypothetical protein
VGEWGWAVKNDVPPSVADSKGAANEYLNKILFLLMRLQIICKDYRKFNS